MFNGSPEEMLQDPESTTGQYLSGIRNIATPASRISIDPDKILKVTGATGNNLKNLTLEIPAGLFICVTGVSGSGKSTLINDTLHRLAASELYNSTALPAPYKTVENLGLFDKVVDIDQSPIGRTPRSNPATYTGLFTPIRDLFAGTQEARARGYKPRPLQFQRQGRPL